MAEKEYIERKDLINGRPPQRNPDQAGKEEYNKGYNDGIKAVLACIENQPPADVVEVVRCKDCKHFLFDTEYCKEHNRGYCEFDNTIKTRNHFCGYGERKDG